MSYRDRLYPWYIIRHLPDAKSMVVGRLRRRNEAEAHLQILKQLMPKASFSIIFDPMLYSVDASRS
jgi:hypothetical protein